MPDPSSDSRILTKRQQERSLLKFLGLGVLVLAILIGFGVAEAGGPGFLVGLVVAVVGALLVAVWSRRTPASNNEQDRPGRSMPLATAQPRAIVHLTRLDELSPTCPVLGQQGQPAGLGELEASAQPAIQLSTPHAPGWFT
jgi:hypothetical protein